MAKDSQDISLYFHIPFCSKKCPYCHFYFLSDRPHLQQTFLKALKSEWLQIQKLIAPHRIVSIYFGGGTPTLLDISPILSWIFESRLNLAPHCEFTIEANPEKLHFDQLQKLRKNGINRISIGIQSFDDSSLQIIERPHSAIRAKESVLLAQQAGFDNISIDLMYDLPHQTLDGWEKTIHLATQLPITHISLYNLTIEPHTPFDRKRTSIQRSMPGPDLSLRLLQTAVAHFESQGFDRYEISAFAKKGFQSIHNSGYWLGRPFLGLGPSAFSFWNGSRFQNIANLHRYAEMLEKDTSPIAFQETLPYPANVNEQLAIRLRLLRGIDENDWDLPPETIANLHQLKKDGFLHQNNTHWQLTQQGTLFYDFVAESLISEPTEPPTLPSQSEH